MHKLMIGICDDEKIIVSQLEEKISDIMRTKNIDYAIQSFLSGRELIKQVSILNLVFLDIEMPDMDGIEVGMLINSLDTNCKIIMATGREDRYKEAFKVNAFRFITKPFNTEEIKEAISDYLELNKGMEKVRLYKDRNSYDVMQRDIRYIIAYNGYTEYKVKDSIFRREESLIEIEKQLDNLFFRVNKKCIVNMRWIKRYEKGVVLLEDRNIEVSRRRRKSFEMAWLNWDINDR